MCHVEKWEQKGWECNEYGYADVYVPGLVVCVTCMEMEYATEHKARLSCISKSHTVDVNVMIPITVCIATIIIKHYLLMVKLLHVHSRNGVQSV